MINIGIITSAKFPPEEGIGNYIMGLTNELVKEDFNITIITRSESLYWREEKINNNLNLIKIPFVPLYPAYMSLHGIFLNEYLKKKKFDLLNIHSPLVPTIHTKAPIISMFHTMMKNDAKSIESKGINPIARKIMTRTVSIPLEIGLISRSDRILTVSSRVSMELNEYDVGQEGGISCRERSKL